MEVLGDESGVGVSCWCGCGGGVGVGVVWWGVVWFGGWCVGVGEFCFFVAVFWVFVFLVVEVGGAFGAAAVGDLYPGTARGRQYRDRVLPYP